MSPDDKEPPSEDPDVIAERIIATLDFLTDTAKRSDIEFFVKPLTRCHNLCQIAYLKDKRRRFPSRKPPKPTNGS